MDPLAPEPRRPRPVAGLPLADARDVVRAWLLELIASASLEDAAALPTADLVREGPALAEAVLAALSDDRALARLAPGGDLAGLALRTAGLPGPAGGAGAVRAAEALRRATQAVILTAARLDAVTTAELADRLAHVCALVAEAAAGERSRDAPAADPRPAPISAPEGDVVELHRGPDAPRERDEHGSHEAAIARRLERHAHDGSPFAVLAVEADGLERLLASQAGGEVDLLLEELERALAAELRPADQLLRDQPGRYWVTAPDTGPTVGRLLAERLAEAATAAASHRGAPLTVSIGVAACPEDGTDVERLVGRADQALFRARAAGTPVV